MLHKLFSLLSPDLAWRDLKQGARSLFRTPVTLIVAVLSLALGVGATSTIYGLVDTLLLHDVTARQPEQLVSLWAPWTSYPNYKEVRSSRVFQDLTGASQCYPALHWRDGDQLREINAECVLGNFFSVIGMQAALGRVFTSDDATAELDPRLAVLSYYFWQRNLNADPKIIGRVLTINNLPFTVVGVLPPNYQATEGGGLHPDLFVPFSKALDPNLFDRSAALMNYVGRLAPEHTREQTQQALMAVVRGLEQQYPKEVEHQNALPTLIPVEGLAKFRQGAENRAILAFAAVLGIVSALVLLIACANVAGLLLARGVARRREMAVRMALGARRSQLIRYLLLEAAIVAAIGTVAGIAFTFWIASLLKNVTVPVYQIQFYFLPNWRFAGVAAAISLATILLSGVVPALVSSRTDLSNALRFGRTVTPPLRLRSLLVIAQIAFSVILLTGAFVFVKNLVYVLRFDPGFDFAHTIWLSMPKPQAGPDASPQQIRDRLYHELESQPGVEAVSWAWYLPFNFAYGEPTLHRADSGETFRVTEQGIGPGYLQTMRIPLLSGREFNWNDLNTGTDVPQPVIINEAFARAHFTDRSPVGDRLIGGRNGATKTMVIIGVSANTSFRSPGEKPIPLLQSLSRLTSNFIVRVARPSSVAAPEIAKAMEPSVPGGVTYFTMHERVDRALWPSRASTALLGAFAAIGLVLSLIGLSGISIYNTTRRTSEIGVRMAFGATTGNVMGLMIRESLSLVAIGTGVGIAFALALTRLLNGFLAGSINSWDPGAYLAMLVTIFLTAVVSVWFPSRRATRVDPSISLRSE